MQIDGKSPDLALDKINALKALFPDVFSEGKLDFERLKQLLQNELASKEHYELSWAGKSQARQEIQKQTTATLTEMGGEREENNSPHAIPHTLITGENLEVLRVLQKSYFGKVKMIYIDPPYNTGNDSFVYPDDYAERKIDYEKRADIKDAQGYLNKQDLLRKNTKDSGQFHSVWLSMMYPRLYIARNLLREDGVIFISIDDNEASNLKLLCDEIFGEENFVADIIWHSKYTTSNDAKYASKQHEHILFYTKSLTRFEIGLLDRTEEMDASYKNPDNDIKGNWKATPLHAKSGTENNIYTIIFPNGVTWTAPKGRYPRYSKERLLQIYNENGLYFNKNGGIDKKTYLSEVKQGKTVGTVWSFNEVGSSHQANEQLANILDKGIFDNPKPLNLIKNCIKVANCYQKDIILDFFAGSGTTAQAVMELNEEDGGNRAFICVQLPEPLEKNSEAYKAGYRTIADITEARITKVIEKITKERAGKLDFANKPLPTYRTYRLTDSHFKIWQSEIIDKEGVLAQLDTFQESQKPEATPENMLTELLLKLGIGLGATIKKISFEAGGCAYQVQDLCLCFEGYTEALKEQVLALKPTKLLMLDACFADDNTLKNFQLELKGYEISLTII